MKLQEFTSKVVQALQDFYGSEVSIETHRVFKNNGLQLQGICVLMPDRNIGPTVYLNRFFELYESGEDFGKILGQIIDLYEKNQASQNLDIDFFLDYSKVKRRLVLRLIHAKKNEELLKEIPHYYFHDLAVVCHCLIVNEMIGTGSILIHKHHLQSWKISEEELFREAAVNSPRIQPYCIHRMRDMIKEIMETAVEERIDEICQEYPQNKDELMKRTVDELVGEIHDNTLPMFVLTNSGRYYGAACLLYEGVLEELANEFKDDFYILPSSVHEVILVPVQETDNPRNFNEMVKEVNATQVDPEEWLCDHVYLYKRNNKRIVSLS